MISEAVYEKISSLMAVDDPPIYYGTAQDKTDNRPAPEYFVMLKIPTDDEQPETLCASQGNQGRVQFQFSAVSEASAGGAEKMLEYLKGLVSSIYGNIVYNGTQYGIWNNITTGVNPIGSADSNTWDAIFESTLWWEIF